MPCPPPAHCGAYAIESTPLLGPASVHVPATLTAFVAWFTAAMHWKV